MSKLSKAALIVTTLTTLTVPLCRADSFTVTLTRFGTCLGSCAVVITDNGPLDLNPAPEIIDFSDRLTQPVAAEVCLRTSSKVFVVGSVAQVGDHYLLALKALNCETQSTVASTMANPLSSTGVTYRPRRRSIAIRPQGHGLELGRKMGAKPRLFGHKSRDGW